MFESIAMICYLFMTEPQEIQQPLFEPNETAMEVYTGTFGGEPDDPDEDENEKQE